MRVLALEPWLGGSHERFLAQWRARSEHEVEVVGLPARHWKWRMASGGWRLAEKVRQEGVGRPDVLFASSLCELGQLYGFLPADWGDVPAVLYFHENQLTFPLRAGQERDLTHGWQNLLSCARATRVVFNSGFHRDEVRRAADELLARLPNPKPTAAVRNALASADVVWPGVDLEEIPLGPGAPAGAPLRVGFNHRIEHDKDPVAFLDACVEARRRGAALEVVLLGARFEKAPDGVRERLELLGDAVLFAGFDPDRASYAARLGACDVVVSTAIHEFYGMAMLEALAAGCAVLAPDRLAYPETLPTAVEGVVLHADDVAERLVALTRSCDALRSLGSRERRRRAAGPHDAGATARRLDALVHSLARTGENR
jgi:glycosyltransferase involved in cell wall biosynthesis